MGLEIYKEGDKVEEGKGEGNEGSFSWLVEAAEEEQEHRPACTWISESATQALATVQSWNNSPSLMRHYIHTDPLN